MTDDNPQAQVAYCPECNAEYDSSFNACPEDGAKLYHYQAGQRVADEMVGEVLDGRFRIDEVLGEGGMGKVYLAMQLSVDRPVALKVLHKEMGSNEEFIKRFLREARVISGFNHPNIVSLVDFGQAAEHDLLYLVMEMLHGEDLGELLERGRLQMDLALEIAVQVCAALSEPHANQVIHRDLKPENLYLVATSDGSLQVKVLDFGIAQAAEGNTKLTQTGTVFGTAQYMAPEQAEGGGITAATDVYALGIILFQMLVGRPPFEGDTAMQIMLQHVQTPAPDVRDFLDDEDVPVSLAQLVEQMVRKPPAERPSSVLEVRDRIEAIQRDAACSRIRLDMSKPFEQMFEPWLLEPIHDARATADVDALGQTQGAVPTDNVSSQPAQVPDGPGPTAPMESSSKRSPIALLAVVAVVLLLLVGGAGVAAWLLWTPGEKSFVSTISSLVAAPEIEEEPEAQDEPDDDGPKAGADDQDSKPAQDEAGDEDEAADKAGEHEENDEDDEASANDDEEASADDTSPEDKPKPKPKPKPKLPVFVGTVQGSVGGGGITGGSMRMTVDKSYKINGQLTGKRDGKPFRVAFSGSVGRGSNSINASGSGRDSSVKVSGKLYGQGAGGRISGKLNGERFSLRYNIKK